MSTLKDQLKADLTAAMRSRDQVRAGTIRMALTAVTTEEVAGTQHRELTDDDVLKVLAKEAKKRREAAEAYTTAGRTELADTEQAELAVLEGYLPKQLDESELEAIVREAVAGSGASGMQQMGLAMKAANAAVAGRAEGGRVAAIVRRVLAG
ncbi:GatB/YqeY domain-containing protein [Intrasporangium calvum]|uniref:GatB/YqeY domain protein n=1 Tax=Intrasporangium calvum (strain ATCC 23552 / DSM 43043 / JCM 3097 / NBRC 12989 / NCIMB 10167 / NRRL B-3866 / 7 KIP) TaxID=710696 RepID=E6S8P6_INTC7|nr:GatB/YqeY domain-containing protein [Intrasporangium calvum]ADU47015.1 GatB/YqeY domain protein [Intrasporangium calvum DSM 43043]